MSTSQDDKPLSRRELRERQQTGAITPGPVAPGASAEQPPRWEAPAHEVTLPPVTAPLSTRELERLEEAAANGKTLTRREVRELERARLTGAVPLVEDAPGGRSDGRTSEDVVATIAAVTGSLATAPPAAQSRAAEAEASAAAVRAEVERERRAAETAARAAREAAAEAAAVAARQEQERAERAEAARLEAERAPSKRASKKASRKDAAEKAAAEAAAEAEQAAADEAARAAAAESARVNELRAAAEREAEALRNARQAEQEAAAAAEASGPRRSGHQAPAVQLPAGTPDETTAMPRGAAFGAAAEKGHSGEPRLAQNFGASVGSASPASGSAFDDIIARGVDSAAGSGAATSALILPSIPGAGPLTGPIIGLGESLITGTIDLPGSLSNTGQHSNRFEKGELDTMFDHDEDPQPATAGNPVSASRAVSSHTATRDVIAPPAPAKNNRLLMILSITAGALALAVVAVVIIALANGSIGAGP